MVARAQIVLAIVAYSVICAYYSASGAFTAIMKLGFAKRHTADGTISVMHICAVALIAVAMLASMLEVCADLAAGGTILIFSLAFIMIAVAHGVSANIADSGVVDYISASDILHTAIAALKGMLTMVKVAYLVACAALLAGTVISVTILVTIGAAEAMLCIAYRAAPYIIATLRAYLMLAHPSFAYCAFCVVDLASASAVLITGTHIRKVARLVVAYASVFTAISAFDVRLTYYLLTAGAYGFEIRAVLAYEIDRIALIVIGPVEYQITFTAVEMLLGAYTFVRIFFHFVRML